MTEEKIEVGTKQQHLDSVPDRYREQYYDPHRKRWSIYHAWERQPEECWKALKKAPKTVAAINEIIGNDSWTKMCCDLCEQDSDVVVVLSSYPGSERSIIACDKCLSEAALKIMAARAGA